VESLAALLADLPFFQGLAPDVVETAAACGSNVRFLEGEPLFRAGDDAVALYVIRHGSVALEPGGIVEAGTVIGWPWLVHPYRWPFGARAVSLVRATALDAACLRVRCEYDARLGYVLMSRFAETLCAPPG
jgi:CRP/FNR family cyclic AMP-dependent transcriptional regulator